jgi:hypothetical protein
MIFILKLQRQSPSSRNPSALLFPGCQPHTCTGLQLRVCSPPSLRTRLWCTMILLLTFQGCPGATSSFIASPLTSSTNVLLKSSHFASHFFCLSDYFLFCRMFGGREMAFFYSRVTSSLLSGQQEAIQTVCSLLREDRGLQELGGYFCRCHMKHE